MDSKTDIALMLQLIPQCAFCVRDGVVTHCNDATDPKIIQPGMKISRLLPDCQPYDQFLDGKLAVTLQWENQFFPATVHKIQQMDVFVFDAHPQSAILKALALAASKIRQPLSDISVITQSLRPAPHSAEDSQLFESTAQLNQRIYQIQRILGNMSDAGMYCDGISANLRVRNIVAVVEEIFERAKILVQYCGIHLSCQLPDEDISCPLDEQLIERAIYNMLSNAMKFTDKGGSILLKLRRQGQTLHLSAEDGGQGIPSQLMGDVFTRFTREPSLEDGRYGIGLGLTMIRCAAAAHNGTVLIDHPEGSGTRITMTISMQNPRNLPVRSPVMQVDYAGERDHALVELADVLPTQAYLD